MKFRTEIDIHRSPVPIDHKDKILMMGSCFTDHIGSKLKKGKFNVSYNPLGIIYNPLSLAKLISHYGIDGKSVKTDELWSLDGIFSHRDFHSENNKPGADEYANSLDIKLDAYCDYLLTCDWLFLTLGTSWAYRFNDLNEIVANCHKKPAHYFEKELLDLVLMIDHLDTALNRLVQINPKVKVVFTVSPVRHLKDGVIENNWSKGRLLDVVHQLVNKYEFISYFPSYEIMMDDLRNYRYYERDLLHPSAEAIDYIWDHFQQRFFGNETLGLLPKISQLKKARNHRPMHPTSDTMIHFCKKNLALIADLRKIAPYLDVSEELNHFNGLKKEFQEATKRLD